MIRVQKSSILIVATASLFCAVALGTPTENQRYPFDPACAWGRLADGKGLIVRCLTREESEQLTKVPMPVTGATPAASAPNPATATTAGAQNTQKSATLVQGATADNAGSGTPTGSTNASVLPTSASPEVPPSGDPSSSSSVPAGSKEALAAEVVSVTADDGELPLAKKKLSAPNDRYAKCVVERGGLTATVAEVTVRFLVRERGRAEGTNVEKFQGMTQAAATCIAAVVDRRPTGVPEAPVVGATTVIRVKKRPTK